MAGAAGSTGFSACSRRALLPLRGTRRRGRSASSPLRTQTSSPTSCEGYEPRSAIARVPARLDAFVSAAPKISRTPRDSRATSPGSSARARSRRRDTVSHLRIHPAWLARYRRRRDSPHRPSRPIPHTKKKIRGFLKHKQWETRVASARTIAHICEGVKHATVADIARLEGVSPEQAVERAAHLKPTSEEDDDAAGDLAFAEFDIVGVLERAAPLLAAKSGDDALFGGAENDKDDAKKQLSKAERLRLAKQTLKQRLGMALDSTLEGAAEERDGRGGDAPTPATRRSLRTPPPPATFLFPRRPIWTWTSSWT